MKDFFGATALTLVLAFAITAVLGPAFIKWLHKLKYGQEIREEGPAWHQKKTGTPTMGGIMFIVGIGVSVIISTIISAVNGTLTPTVMKALILYIVSLGFGVVGFIDDYIKVVKKRNLGLTAIQKFLLQLAFAAAYVVIMYLMGMLRTDVVIPFVKYPVTLPIWLYIPFVMFVVVGTVNAVNLTDGLDGLASSVTVVASLFFALYAFLRISAPEVGVSIYSMAIVGGLFGFLLFNKYPAKVFMGDTGSLFLGGALALIAADLNMHLYLIIVGFVYFAETLSVIMQTSYFKYTKKKYGEGRRIFKMTPIHHHFEMSGWKETKIVAVFSAVTLALCVISYFA
ncbi:MAG: phospho-N-acetylmuramoyl-pentapeptide-transferase [Clostridia bacterium]|nr:phospho-N-acetylmuramoyl-pentapeptide-transferase [Clostridia bacterium]